MSFAAEQTLPQGGTGGSNRTERVRSIVGRVTGKPRAGVATIGRGVMMAARIVTFAVVDTMRRRLPVSEFLTQTWSLLKVTATPAILMAIPFGAMVAVQVSGIVNQVGASSLVGSASGVGVLRQGAPITAGLLMGGAAASAIASDLGARTIREEIDAMIVMGVDPVRRLVVPRFLALTTIAPILCILIISAAVGSSFVLAVAVNGVTSGSFWASFGAFAKLVDVWFAIGKTIVFAMTVCVISALRGMEAKGGARGVADAVNSSVVLSVVVIVVENLAITQFQTMFFPMEVG